MRAGRILDPVKRGLETEEERLVQQKPSAFSSHFSFLLEVVKWAGHLGGPFGHDGFSLTTLICAALNIFLPPEFLQRSLLQDVEGTQMTRAVFLM